MMWDDPDKSKCLARESQKLFLLNSFGKSDGRFLPSALFLWGESCVGKEHVVLETLKDSNITSQAIVNSQEFILGPSVVFRSILNQLAGPGNEYGYNGACDSILKFINGLNVLITQLELGRIVIVIKNVEFLRKDFQDMFILFTTLKDQIQQNICTILCSSLPFSSYYSIIHKKIIPTLYFPQYTKDQVNKILCQSHSSLAENPTDEETEAYETYVQILLTVFYYFNRNLRVLQKLAEHHWLDFKDENPNRSNIPKLWKKIEPKIKRTFNSMNFKILPINDDVGNVEKAEEENNELDLPLYTKYLLISAYIAAQNPVSSDKRFFMKGKEGGSVRKRKAEVFKENKLKGPQVFSQIRFMAILSQILGDKVEATEGDSNFKVHVTSLVHLGLLQFQSTGDKSLDQCKFKCLVDFPFIEKISKSIDFEIKRYLYSFLNTHQ